MPAPDLGPDFEHRPRRRAAPPAPPASSPPSARQERPSSQVVPDWYGSLRTMIRDKIGFVLQPKPTPTLRAVFEARVQGRNRGVQEYLAHLSRADPTDPELMALINVITIKKTHFFRDLGQFEGLRELLRGWRGSGRTIKIWCAGCSTGEEPYSLAMLAHADRVPVEIIGSDINTDALATGRRGHYTDFALGEIPAAFQARYLQPQERGYRVVPEIHGMVRLLHHNLVDRHVPQPAAGGPWDLVLCRNVLIYFEPRTVERVVGHIHTALRREGRLVLGAGESLHGRQADYDLVRLGRSFAYRPAPLGSRPQAGLPGTAVERLTDQSDAALDVAEIAQIVADAARSGELARPADRTAASSSSSSSSSSSADLDVIAAEFRRSRACRGTALQRLHRMLERRPADGVGWLTLGNALLETGAVAEALEAYQTGQALLPLSPEAHFLTGLVHKKAGARWPAIQALRRALFLEPGFWPAAFHLAGLYQHEGMLREAIGEYRNALNGLADPRTATPRFVSRLAGEEPHGRLRAEVRAICEAKLAQLTGR